MRSVPGELRPGNWSGVVNAHVVVVRVRARRLVGTGLVAFVHAAVIATV